MFRFYGCMKTRAPLTEVPKEITVKVEVSKDHKIRFKNERNIYSLDFWFFSSRKRTCRKNKVIINHKLMKNNLQKTFHPSNKKWTLLA
jgi:hypothetical protein